MNVNRNVIYLTNSGTNVLILYKMVCFGRYVGMHIEKAFTREQLIDLAALFHTDALLGRGDVEMKRRAAERALAMADRLPVTAG